MSRFSMTPQVRMNRSRFDLSKGVKTSMSVGRLYPIDIQEVLPGDTFKNKTVCVARVTSSFLKPVMDNAYMDIYHFFVPYRLLYEDTERVFGNPNPSAYVDNNLSEFPTFGTSQTVVSGTIADYLGLPVGTIPGDISVLPFRAFAKVYNQWFRNENTVAETYVQEGEKTESENLNSSEWSPNNYTGLPPFVGKRKDYFTSALPAPQKGAPVQTPLGELAPVIYNPNNHANTALNGFWETNNAWAFLSPNGTPLGLYSKDGYSTTGNTLYSSTISNDGSTGVPISYANGSLVADLSQATATNINDLRFAFQLQKMLERDALYGKILSIAVVKSEKKTGRLTLFYKVC